MRQFVIDELSPMERDNIDSYLKRNTKIGPMIGLYWIVLPEELLSEAQLGHEEHGPFYIAVEVEQHSVKFELLVRSKSNLHCTCIAHASPEQRQYILGFIDKMVTEEMIRS
ncbi:hypothetical protein [Desulfotalea psychrophila]|uniref:Uncharacterized protein n=1 Tax=Desulfotalea psychrophila (strain LSv54 / DSM 12343) TaxID=177439 RepID=Q6AS19_DESPS|nr:hypothetical protein [Desulfotalea psychrophila]CAG34856.1 unknown protein [Desulfotalea psychrophila LSv54]